MVESGGIGADEWNPKTKWKKNRTYAHYHYVQHFNTYYIKEERACVHT